MSYTKILVACLFGGFLVMDSQGMENNLKTRGLYNEEKSCWFNSSIQFLHASPSFRKLVSDIDSCSKSKNASKKNASKKHNSIAKHLVDLFEFLENGNNEHGTMDDFLEIDVWPKNSKLQVLTCMADCNQDGAKKLQQWVSGEDDGVKSEDLRKKIVKLVLKQAPKYEGTFSEDGSGHTRLFIEALIDGLEREIVDNFVRACGAQVYRNDLKKKVKAMKLKRVPVDAFKLNAESIDEYNRGLSSDPFTNKSLIEILEVPKNKVSESVNNIDSLYQRFCRNIRDIVSFSEQQERVNERFAITPWGYKEGNYDIRFDMKEVYIENAKSEAYIENVRSKADVEKVKSSIRRIGQRDIIIQEIEDINSINSLRSLEGIDQKTNEDRGIVYYDLPGGYKSILNSADPYFSNISSVMLRYATSTGVHTANAVRRDSENFIFISDNIVATKKINSWTDLHEVASEFLLKSYPYKPYYICPERVLYDFGNVNQ